MAAHLIRSISSSIVGSSGTRRRDPQLGSTAYSRNATGSTGSTGYLLDQPQQKARHFQGQTACPRSISGCQYRGPLRYLNAYAPQSPYTDSVRSQRWLWSVVCSGILGGERI